MAVPYRAAAAMSLTSSHMGRDVREDRGLARARRAPERRRGSVQSARPRVRQPATARTRLRRIQQPSKFNTREDVRHKQPGQCWNVLRQRRPADVSAGDCKAVKAGERLMLAVPETGGRPIAGDKVRHRSRFDLGEVFAFLMATEGLQDAPLAVKAHPHGLFVCDVLTDCLEELHSKPARLKSATSRNPARSTLA